jgi:DNA-binding CsgD family transcriptional regulator
LPHQHGHSADKRSLRRSGIDRIGDLPWGAHICLFYETPDDLLFALCSYFRAGLEDGEACLWALSDPVNMETGLAALREAIPDFDSYLDAGAIELVSGYEWYMQGDEFDHQRVTSGWREKQAAARERGFKGLRASGNAFWIESSVWKDFCAYEAELDYSIADREMLVLCTYSLQASRAVDLLDVARTHNFSVARRSGRWEFLETPELASARRQIDRLNGAIDVLSKEFPGRENLTPSERIALAQIVRGDSSKEAARHLNISHRTVEFHRANLMRKLGARNVVELIRMVLVDET